MQIINPQRIIGPIEELNMNEKINNYKWTYDEIDKILSNSTKDNIEQSLVKIGKLLQQKINALKSLKQLQLNNINLKTIN